MKKANNSNSTSLVKIDSKLYKKIRDFVKLHKMEYPSIKHFIESVVMKSLGFKRYDIERIDVDSNLAQPLSNVVGEQGGGYTMCSLCKKVFFRHKLDKNKFRICPSCIKITEQYKDLIDEEKQKNIKIELIKDEKPKKQQETLETNNNEKDIEKILKQEIDKLRTELMKKIDSK